MKIVIKVTKSFERQAKPLLKKYPSLQDELLLLQDKLNENPKYGISIGHNIYKIRLSVKSKGKGKSAGLRVISFLDSNIVGYFSYGEKSTILYLIAIYDKSETGSISNKSLRDFISKIS
jgi:mRNA-degrading endonuclease RelE of RelBE toxin-antitoxin system